VHAGKARCLQLDSPNEELPLLISLEHRTAEVGRAGSAIYRKLPHAVCSNFLPALTQPREWRAGRHALTPEAALDLAFGNVAAVVVPQSEAVAFSLPSYLTPPQTARVVAAATRFRFPLKGTSVGSLAIVADRASAVLNGKPVTPEPASPDWVVPLRPTVGGPGAVVVVDVDEFSLSASVIAVERERVRLLGSACCPKLAVKVWKERLLDAISDRCVRLCRRDPRDSASAEQALFEQLDDAIDASRAGRRVTLTVRTAHWYQDVLQQPDDFANACALQARSAAEEIRDLLTDSELPIPPRAVWLTHEAGRLPGLTHAIHQGTPEGTAVELLPPNAAAQAAASLVPRWLAGELPRAHLDASIPLQVEAGTRTRDSGRAKAGEGK
jgi:hypothetical protein